MGSPGRRRRRRSTSPSPSTPPRPPLRGLALGVAAVAEPLDRPATNLVELAARLNASPRAVMLALRRPSICALVVVADDGSLRAAPGATSATLPGRQRPALAPRPA